MEEADDEYENLQEAGQGPMAKMIPLRGPGRRTALRRTALRRTAVASMSGQDGGSKIPQEVESKGGYPQVTALEGRAPTREY